MPLALHLGTADLTRCRFAISPLCQTHEALRMLRRPARHVYHRGWLRRMRRAVSGLDLAELWLFIPPVGGYTPDFLGPPPQEPYPTIEDELARMRATDPVLAHAEMTRSLACTPELAESPQGRAALDDPAATVRRLADLTERAWHALLAQDWPRHRAARAGPRPAASTRCSPACTRPWTGPARRSPCAGTPMWRMSNGPTAGACCSCRACSCGRTW
jgi:hypothetical protein